MAKAKKGQKPLSIEKALAASTAKPTLRRGQGVRLSTEAAEPAPPTPEAPPQERETANPHNRTSLELQEVPVSAPTTAPPLSVPPPAAATAPVTAPKAPTATEHKRINRGYKLREDLVKACKRLAIDEDQALYEVMEAAILAYLKEKKRLP